MRNRYAAVFALTALIGLSACNRSADKPGELIEDNLTTEVPVDEAIPANVAEAPLPEPAPINVANAVAPPPSLTETQQMRDDADAAGLTSRLPAEEPMAAANETQPAQ